MGTGEGWPRRGARLGVALLLLAASPAAGGFVVPGPVAGPPEILGRLAGPGATTVPPGLFLYGTDLGWTFTHQGQLQILFGDTWIVSNSRSSRSQARFAAIQRKGAELT